MAEFQPEKLHVRLEGKESKSGWLPRRYTLTHSDRTGDLFLTIASEYDRKQVSGWYTRLMRDEVLAEWRSDEARLALDVHVHVSGGLVLGGAAWRASIFKHHMPQVLQAIRYGDREHFAEHPQLDLASIRVHFHSHKPEFQAVESWGTSADYRAGLAQP